MNVGGSIYILKGNFSLRLEKVLDPPFKATNLLHKICFQKLVVLRKFVEEP